MFNFFVIYELKYACFTRILSFLFFYTFRNLSASFEKAEKEEYSSLLHDLHNILFLL